MRDILPLTEKQYTAQAVHTTQPLLDQILSLLISLVGRLRRGQAVSTGVFGLDQGIT